MKTMNVANFLVGNGRSTSDTLTARGREIEATRHFENVDCSIMPNT